MKKTLSLLLAGLMMFSPTLSASAAQINSPAASDYLQGDLDGDGEVTSLDAMLALRNSANLETFTSEQLLSADVNSDGTITPADSFYLLRQAVKLPTTEILPPHISIVNTNAQINYYNTNNTYKEGSLVEVTYYLRNIENVSSFKVGLNFNPEYVAPSYENPDDPDNPNDYDKEDLLYMNSDDFTVFGSYDSELNPDTVLLCGIISAADTGFSYDPLWPAPVVTVTFRALQEFSETDLQLGITEYEYTSINPDDDREICYYNSEDSNLARPSYVEVNVLEWEDLYQKGDTHYDLTITPLDAAYILRKTVHLEEFSYEQNLAADVDNDGAVTSADALLVLRYSVGIYDDFVNFNLGIYEPKPMKYIPYAIEDNTLYHYGDIVTVEYCLHNISNVAELAADLYYDPEYIELISYETDSSTICNNIAENIIRIASIYGDKGDNRFAGEEEPVIKFTFQALKDFTLYDLNIYEETFELATAPDDLDSLWFFIDLPNQSFIDTDYYYSKDNYSLLNMWIDNLSGKEPETTETPYVIIGDADGDGKITSGDSLLVLRASVGLENIDYNLMRVSDIDNDDRITSADSLAVLRHSVGLTSYHIGDTLKKL